MLRERYVGSTEEVKKRGSSRPLLFPDVIVADPSEESDVFVHKTVLHETNDTLPTCWAVKSYKFATPVIGAVYSEDTECVTNARCEEGNEDATPPKRALVHLMFHEDANSCTTLMSL